MREKKRGSNQLRKKTERKKALNKRKQKEERKLEKEGFKLRGLIS